MRLRFREAGIKRLEAVASSKISAEKHLLEERSELLKEIEVLRTQVDRNQEVTRFAMENLKLKEELRRQDFSYICLFPQAFLKFLFIYVPFTLRFTMSSTSLFLAYVSGKSIYCQ